MLKKFDDTFSSLSCQQSFMPLSSQRMEQLSENWRRRNIAVRRNNDRSLFLRGLLYSWSRRSEVRKSLAVFCSHRKAAALYILYSATSLTDLWPAPYLRLAGRVVNILCGARLGRYGRGP